MRAVSITNRGGRENNEDSVRHAKAGDIRCFVVCDGLGGHECGEVASQMIAEGVCKSFEKNPEISEKSIKSYLDNAAKSLSKARSENPDKYNMSSTAVVLLTDGKKAVWAHVGDSRLYYITGRQISLITDDHSVAFFEFESGLITYDDIRRSPNQNMLVRCIGDYDSFNPDISEVTELKKGDAFLLCSDGFWEYVNEDEMEATLKKTKSPKQWMEKMLKILHENETERNDNYTAIAVMV